MTNSHTAGTKIVKTRHTDETGIVLAKFAPAHWRHADTSCGARDWPSAVGPIYRTKLEALAAHEQYMRDAGWIKHAAR